jgi:acetoacetate decarboxylase
MMKQNASLIVMVCICIVLGVSLVSCTATDNTADENPKPEWASFVPSPEFSPPYPPLPHHFNDMHGLQILCRAPEGAIERALAKPLEKKANDDLFVLQMGWSPDCEGFNVHEIQINAPVKWGDNIGSTTLIEYIDSDMGLIAGREIWGWPKKMSEIIWTQTDTGWTIECYKQKDQGSIPLMKVEYTISDSTPDVAWPDMEPVYLVKRIPNASPSVPPLTPIVCVGCNRPPDSEPAFDPSVAAINTKGTATVQFFDGPHDQLTFFGPVEVLDARMNIFEGSMTGGLGLGEVVDEWVE